MSSVTDPGLEIEQMVRFLCAHANHFTIITSNTNISVYAAWMRGRQDEPLLLGQGPTLREALAAACEWCRAHGAGGAA